MLAGRVGSSAADHPRLCPTILLLQGLDAVSKLESGDRIVAVKVVSGLDKLTAS